MKVQVNTTEYEFSHGKKPRGFGQWVFFFGNVMFTYNGTYGDAKKAAMKTAKEQGYTEVMVGA